MATISLVVNTDDKENSYVEIDGRRIENVTSVRVYELGSEYASIEINQHKANDDGTFQHISTYASANSNNITLEEKPIIDHKALAKVLLQRDV